jgi:DNA repair protein SbcC/Rad50
VRPLRIEVEGFGSFRDPAAVELADVDLFVLSGPTGAGKSTLVEAAVFACYGTVPRYDDRRLVAPVINQGRNEARVRLTFGVGERRFQATRVVRRTKQGATTKEARLEEITGGGARTLAGNADELTAAVTGLLGLSFEQFTRSVVLPQGAFDRFLFAKPAERADLLVQLLDLGVYEDVGRRARVLATAADARAGELQRRLDGELALATPEVLAAADTEVARLERLGTRCEELAPQLDRALEEGRAAREAADRAAADLAALTGLARPEAVTALAAEVEAATATASAAEEEATAATGALDAAETRRDALPPPEGLAALRRALDDLVAATGDLDGAGVHVERAQQATGPAAEAETAAAAAVEAARRRLEEVRRAGLAHDLAQDLTAGAPCPVCRRELDDVPVHDPPDGLDAARDALLAAEQAQTDARAHRETADRELAVHEAAERSARERADRARAAFAAAREEVEPRLVDGSADAGTGSAAQADGAGSTDDASLDARLHASTEAVDTARRAVDAAREAERSARRRAGAAREQLEAVRRRTADAWSAFDEVRDGVARLGPPPVDRGDLGGSWDTLLAWADDRRPAAARAAEEADRTVAAARERWRELDATLRRECDDAGVTLAEGAAPALAVATATESARHRRRRLEQLRDEAELARSELRAAEEERTVAKALGDHLRADGFERWLLARALRVLVRGASTILRELSSGSYSLLLDDASQFLVVDHRNADEPRTVRSLSGGERFLASLSLALALAEHVAELAADGAARLESLFLDEGFGSLDADTLDVVAAAIEELGARGRMVGVVTHVRDLAERLPVRFEVRRGPTGSTVRRHDAGTAAAAHTLDAAADGDDDGDDREDAA